jgi:hypothetical protein
MDENTSLIYIYADKKKKKTLHKPIYLYLDVRAHTVYINDGMLLLKHLHSLYMSLVDIIHMHYQPIIITSTLMIDIM